MISLSKDEFKDFISIYHKLRRCYPDLLTVQEFATIKEIWLNVMRISDGEVCRDEFGFHPLIESVKTVDALCAGIAPDKSMIVAIMLFKLGHKVLENPQFIATFGEEPYMMVERLHKVATLYGKQTSIADENFSKLLMAFAQDIRVIIIMIVNKLVLMRAINHHPDEASVKKVALESALLYAPIAHRLGLYKIKGELEDLSLKYSNRDIFMRIARKLNESKKRRDEYIANFIAPVKTALEKEGLKFEIKGRTKSIFSIWNKMRKQNNDVENIYDLFAIRIILDTPLERERRECWLAYSIVADMFQPNPARFKDWISIPKSNGYESLHTTVAGPEGKWVEVQIRTKRMDEVAEKGVAAHWRYKGLKSENELDVWMNRVREILETADQTRLERMRNLDVELYSKEIYVFTPKGDLFKLPQGATVLDFAFAIHSNLGCKCIGGKVDGATKKLNAKLNSGDTVEILSSANQQPKLDWVQYVVTAKAKNKIRQAVKEIENKTSNYAKELLHRRFKNRKIEIDDGQLMKLIKRLGFKTVSEFFGEIADGRLDVNNVIDRYTTLEASKDLVGEKISAEDFMLQKYHDEEQKGSGDSDVLVIGDNISKLNYRLSKCCNPIYGDSVFGFISSEGVVKIHRTTCPNADNIRTKYPYRIISVRWSGKQGSQLSAIIKVIGYDDIGIVTNISSIINKEPDVSLREIDIKSNDGLFHGILTVGVKDFESLNNVIKKIKTVKGVKDVSRS